MKNHALQPLAHLLIVIGLTSFCAAVQAADTPTAGEQTISKEGRARAAQGYKLGSFNILPQIKFEELWDDNIFATDSNVDEESDFITIVTPSLLITSGWDRHELNFRAGASFSAYAEHDDEDTQDAWIDVEGRYDFTDSTNVFGGIGYSREHEDRASPDDVNGIDPILYRVLRSHIGLYHKSGPFTVRAGGTFDELDFDDVNTLTTEINNDDRDRDLYSVGARIAYKFSPMYEAFVQLATDTRRYDESLDNNLQDRNSDGHRIAAGLAITNGARFKGEFLIGSIDQNYDDAALQDVDVTDYGVKLTWRPSASTIISANVDRTLEETTLINASSFLNTSAGIGIQHKVSPRTILKASVSASENDYQGTSREDDFSSWSAGIQYKIARHFYAEGNYFYSERDSNINNEDFDRNQVLFQLRAEIAPGFGASPLLVASNAPISGDVSADVSGFYIGAQVGVGGLGTTLIGPRGGMNGSLQSDFGNSGSSAGLFAGYGVRLNNNWYVGLDFEADSSSIDWYHERQTGRIFSVEQDEKYVLAGRLGYMRNNGNLLYGRAGFVRSNFDTTYRLGTGEIFDTDETINGYLFGGGTEIPFTEHLFLRMDYAYTDYSDNNVSFGTGTDEFDTGESLLHIGLGWRLNSQRIANHLSEARSRLPGFYIGGRFGYGQLDTAQDAVHREPGSTTNFTADFGDHGATWGVFAGWGTMLSRVYLGLELEAEAGENGWEHLRDPVGRDYSVEKKDSHGGSVRVGYVLRNGTLLYGKYGRVRTTFNTIYTKGNNAANFIDKDNEESGKRYGLGAEMSFSKNLFGRAEYTYTKYDDDNFTTSHGNPDDVSLETSEGLFSVGIGWRF